MRSLDPAMTIVLAWRVSGVAQRRFSSCVTDAFDTLFENLVEGLVSGLVPLLVQEGLREGDERGCVEVVSFGYAATTNHADRSARANRDLSNLVVGY
jgi:hypothetical protein